MKVYIITGASKGIGHAMATILEAEGHKVLRIARSNPNNLPNLLTLDITESVATNRIIEWLTPFLPIATEINLINNAGIVEPINLVGELDDEKMTQAIALNITALVRLTNAFVNSVQSLAITKNVMNISSGAGRHVYEGWSIYCMTKAAVDHFSRAMHLEQTEQKHPIQVVAIAPGVIDTDMQNTIRGSNKEAFPNVERFKAMKASGSLLSPQECASKLLSYLHSPLMQTNGAIADIRDI